MRRLTLIVAAAVVSVSAGALEGQVGGRERPAIIRPGRRADQVRPNAAQVPRQVLEQQIRRGFWRVAKQRIGFNDEQMLRLERTTVRYDQRRRALAQEERAQRIALRTEMLADSSANQSSIAAALEQLHQLQRQRLDLQSEEQKELATFMTPLQRAKFFALQEQIRRRLQELVTNRPDSVRPNLPLEP